jgi:hypothetical protein
MAAMTRAANAKEIVEPTSSEPSSRTGVGQRAEELAARISSIRADARRDPQAYLRETLVPEGGE